MKRYSVNVTRISYASIEFEVEADSPEKAKKLAEQKAYNTGFHEDSAEYEIDDPKIIG